MLSCRDAAKVARRLRKIVVGRHRNGTNKHDKISDNLLNHS